MSRELWSKEEELILEFEKEKMWLLLILETKVKGKRLIIMGGAHGMFYCDLEKPMRRQAAWYVWFPGSAWKM